MRNKLAVPVLLAITSLAAGCNDRQPVAPHAPESAASEARVASGGFLTWLPMESDVTQNLQAVWGTDVDHVFAGGASGSMQWFDGVRWTRQPLGTVSVVNAIWGSAPDNVWAVGGLGALLHYDGSGWDLAGRLEANDGVRYQLFGLWGTSASDVWTVGNAGTTHHYDGSGWTYSAVPSQEVLRAVWSSGPGDVVAVGEQGGIYHHDGAAWASVPSPTSIRLNAVHGRSADDVFAGGSFGVILHFDGVEWREDAQSRRVSSAHIRDIWGDGEGNVLAAAWGGTILRHDGRTWEVLRTGTDTNLEGVWGVDGRFFAVGASGSVYRGGRGIGAGGSPPGRDERPIWPLAGTRAFDADSIHSPYGPRMLPRGHDFHAGIDIPAPRGTPAHVVLSGTVVETRTWDGVSIGAGNAVTVRHPNGIATSYLHLDEIRVAEGDRLAQGDAVGTVGSTGATYSHLHLGYFRTLNFDNVDERLSYNPLELLAHGNRRDGIDATFSATGVTLSVPLQRMTVQTIELRGGAGESRVVDYSAVVQRGLAGRREPVQFGVRLEPARPEAGRFDLTLTPLDFAPDRVIVTDIHGRTILNARRP
jgi:hypothetical protein